MKKTRAAYYVITVIFTLLSLFASGFELSMNPMAVELLKSLGYPVYFNYILGFARIFGVIGIWQNKVKFLVEWAYAGFVIDFLAAIVSHLLSGQPFSSTLPALMNLVIILVSYTLYRKTLRLK